MSTSYTTIESPIGELLLASEDGALTALYMQQAPRPFRVPASWTRDPDSPVLRAAEAELQQYFSGERDTFTIPLAAHGNEFEQRVWDALREIPYGETVSYGEVARRIGAPTAARAVGLANGRNPISVIVPCHRVIGANGSLTGYGGGLERKRYLLDLEAAGRFAGHLF
jgi:methylated-DNA-[protein]-cysteine S-methyltransferase